MFKSYLVMLVFWVWVKHIDLRDFSRFLTPYIIYLNISKESKNKTMKTYWTRFARKSSNDEAMRDVFFQACNLKTNI